MKKMGFALAVKKYFGFLPGQNLTGFLQELQNLTKQDKDELVPLLEAQFDCTISE